MTTAIEAPLTAAEAAVLRRLAGIMIPADAALGVPGADDACIFDDLRATLGRDTAEVKTALVALEARAGGGFLAMEEASASAAAMHLLAEASRPVLALGRVVLAAYYRDARVLRSIGREPRAPFPQGHPLPDGDWSLLQAVRGRAPLWRDDRQA